MSDKFQLGLFDHPAHIEPFDIPSQSELWGMFLADELTLDQWAQIANYLYPLSPEELDLLSPRQSKIERK